MKSDAEREALERQIAELEALIRRNMNNGDTLRLSFLRSELAFLQSKLRALDASVPSDSRDPHVAIRNMASADSPPAPSPTGVDDPESAVPPHRNVPPERWRIVDDEFKALLSAHPWLRKAGAHVKWVFDIQQQRFEPKLQLQKTLSEIAASGLHRHEAQRILRIYLTLKRTNAVLDRLQLQNSERFQLVLRPDDVTHLVQWSVELERQLMEGQGGQDPAGLDRTDEEKMADVMRLSGRLLRHDRRVRPDDPLPFLLLDAAARRYRGLLDSTGEGSPDQSKLSQKLQATQDLHDGSWDCSRFMNPLFDFVGYSLQSWLKDWGHVTEHEGSLGRRLDLTAERFKQYADLGLYPVAFLGQCLLGLFAKALLQEDKAKEIFETAAYYHDRARLLGMLSEADQLMAVEGELFFTSLMNDAGIPRDAVGDVPRGLARTWLSRRQFVSE